MRWSLRTRIVLSAFAASMLLLLAEAAFFLNGFNGILYSMVDENLREELNEVREISRSGLEEHLRFEMATDPEGNELFFEIRDPGDEIVMLSENLAGEPLPRTKEGALVGEVRFRDEAHPRLGGSGRLVRVGEADLGDYRVQIAATLEPLQGAYAKVRTGAIVTLVLFALLATGGAYLVASRALRPLQQLTDTAKRLSVASEGMLPETGTGGEIDELAAVLNELLTRVRAYVGKVRRFTADAAHQLRTPLTAVRGHLEILTAAGDPAERDELGGIIEEVDRLGELVNGLLLLEKLESDGQSGVPERLDLGEVARSLVDHLEIVATDRGIRLTCDAEKSFVLGDLSQLRQLLFNLLDNALEFAPRGGEVGISIRRLGDGVEAIVRDTGPGIPTGDTERIFERFYSSRNRPEAGAGLGLAIARAIATAHHGTLVARSKEGAELVLRLPVAP
jgi:signal transduction histidine kinase